MLLPKQTLYPKPLIVISWHSAIQSLSLLKISNHRGSHNRSEGTIIDHTVTRSENIFESSPLSEGIIKFRKSGSRCWIQSTFKNIRKFYSTKNCDPFLNSFPSILLKPTNFIIMELSKTIFQ